MKFLLVSFWENLPVYGFDTNLVRGIKSIFLESVDRTVKQKNVRYTYYKSDPIKLKTSQP
ncbi:hypothetical protein LIMHP_05055 [Leptospira interrogans serovar Manilae]|nr:hypothetical protein LIMLP_05070 [Leptospira interrogans serovar Manilae]AKP29153.1 hypothetical protein LIMHP_05055 [Leptospira interrogans serovar Manilae]EYU65064.1 hypothetical protein CI00_14040 [Leptospira interrogans serovar Manilae]